ncbi:MAG TPA: DUF4249 domain-containing protein [Flavisolibacter sp.]|jgi:hypothetical protein|nr:DUF4249 domain-containing protein [Flavisolibacter sp.]
MKKWAIWMGLGYLLLTGCEKNIDFNLKEADPKLVVEATIENDEAPQVILTRSTGYFSAISPDLLANSFVHDAEVTVGNGTLIHRLKEYQVPVGPGINFYYYSIDSSQLSTAFKGALNTRYSLKIVAEGQTYTATTIIPNITKRIDSLWWKKTPAAEDSNQVVVMVRATDPKGYGDYVRYFTKKNREPFYPAFNSVFDDLFIDGTTYELQVEPGADRNVKRNDDDNFFNRGDTVTFKLSNIDKPTFDFWRTMEYSYASVGNPFASPVKVLSNINNGALGYFGGYASQYHTLIIPK